jgi:hypothetical protein
MTDPDEPSLPVTAFPAKTPLPFEDLRTPVPIPAAPPLAARVLAFASILAGGLLGAMIGYGTADLMSGATGWALLGLLVGAAAGAVGVGVVASLTLRAMNEWTATPHPEAGPRPGRRRRD